MGTYQEGRCTPLSGYSLMTGSKDVSESGDVIKEP